MNREESSSVKATDHLIDRQVGWAEWSSSRSSSEGDGPTGRGGAHSPNLAVQADRPGSLGFCCPGAVRIHPDHPSSPRPDGPLTFSDAVHNDNVDLMPLRQAIAPPIALTGRLRPTSAVDVDPDLEGLLRTAHAIAVAYHSDDYGTVAELLPALVHSAHATVEHFDHGPHQTDALRVRSDVLQMTGRHLTQVRAYDLAHIALRDAIQDALRIGDIGAVAGAVYQQGWPTIRATTDIEVARLRTPARTHSSQPTGRTPWHLPGTTDPGRASDEGRRPFRSFQELAVSCHRKFLPHPSDSAEFTGP
jgi:hypothetical protein